MVLRAAICPSEREISCSERRRRSSEHRRRTFSRHLSRSEGEISLCERLISPSEGHECRSEHQISRSEGQLAAPRGNFADRREEAEASCAGDGVAFGTTPVPIGIHDAADSGAEVADGKSGGVAGKHPSGEVAFALQASPAAHGASPGAQRGVGGWRSKISRRGAGGRPCFAPAFAVGYGLRPSRDFAAVLGTQASERGRRRGRPVLAAGGAAQSREGRSRPRTHERDGKRRLPASRGLRAPPRPSASHPGEAPCAAGTSARATLMNQEANAIKRDLGSKPPSRTRTPLGPSMPCVRRARRRPSQSV